MLGERMPRDWEAFYRLGRGPSEPAWVVTAYAGEVPGGRVLDLAGGAGRNALFLASRGHEVVLVEGSREAVRRAREAAGRGAPLLALVRDLEAGVPELPPGPYSGVVMTYYVNRPLLARIPGLLAPGGLALLEGYSRREAARRGRERSPRYWDELELARPPGGLSLLAWGAGRWGGGHRVFAVWRRL